MKLQNQVCTMEQAEKLKELGVIQASLFSWVKHKQTAFPEPSVFFCGEIEDYKKEFGEGCFGITVIGSAFTVAELGAMLPATIDELKLTQWPIPDSNSKTISYGIQYRRHLEVATYSTYPLHVVFGDNEAKARADLLISLIADGKISADEVNQRLQGA